MHCCIKEERIQFAGLFCVLFALVGLSSGCSEGRPERVAVSGRVTIDGEPLKFGSVLFVPTNGRVSGGAIDEEGHFVLTCYEPEDGVIPGKYQVSVRGTEPMGEVAQRWHAPMKYAKAETSGIEYDLTEPTESILIELTWDGKKPFVEKF